MAPAVGIDLGTTNSCVAVCRDGRVEIIPNGEGERLTPSVVSFGAERLVGQAARDREALDPQNTVYDVKRLIGRRFEDEVVRKDKKNWPYKVVSNKGRLKISVQYLGAERTLYPEQISAMVLMQMKEAAAAYLGCEVRDAVVTVPAYFTDSQRQATKDAAAIAKLNVLRIINEPTAGALAYGLRAKDGDERNVLVFDFGGGTFDVTVLTIADGAFKVRSTAGNTRLGGSDLDSRLVDHFADEFQRLHNRSLRDSPKALMRLRIACELVKRKLSTATEASEHLPALAGVDFQVKLTRARFEELCSDLFNDTLETVRAALSDAKLEKSEISDVVLVGGSTRIPAVRELLQYFFDGKELKQTVNPDEAVAAGAALQAALLSNDASVKDLKLLDVTPHSLGIETRGGKMVKLIDRNTTIPHKYTRTFQPAIDNQIEVIVQVFEGEQTMTQDNRLLGRFMLSGFPPGPRRLTRIDVTFEINENGILEVSAVEQSTKKTSKITITNDKGPLSKDEVDKLVEEGEQFNKDEEVKKAVARAKNALEEYCLQTKGRAQNETSKDKIPSEDLGTILQKCDETIKWMEDMPQPATAEEFEVKLKDLEEEFKSILL